MQADSWQQQGGLDRAANELDACQTKVVLEIKPEQGAQSRAAGRAMMMVTQGGPCSRRRSGAEQRCNGDMKHTGTAELTPVGFPQGSKA